MAAGLYCNWYDMRHVSVLNRGSAEWGWRQACTVTGMICVHIDRGVIHTMHKCNILIIHTITTCLLCICVCLLYMYMSTTYILLYVYTSTA